MDELKKWIQSEITEFEIKKNGAQTANNMNSLQELQGYLDALKSVLNKIEEIKIIK